MIWEFREDRIYATFLDNEDPNAELYDVCERVEVVTVINDLLTDMEYLEILLYKAYDIKLITIERSEISEKKVIGTLTSYGLTIQEDEDFSRLIKTILTDTEAEAPVKYVHHKLGFLDFRGNQCFLGHHPIGRFSEIQRQSEYSDDSILKPKGSWRTWRKLILKFVPNSPPLSLAMALAVTAPVAYLLQKQGIYTEVPLWGIIGDTSVGKTSLLIFQSAFWGNYSKFIENFDATSNAFAELLKQRNGLPTFCDEATYTPSLDWDWLLYSLPSGKDKLRCNKDGTLKKVTRFSGSIVLTSERSIIERSKNLGGQQVRIVEFTEKWFNSGDEAEYIKSICSRNYGWGTEPLINLLLSEGFDNKLENKFKSFYHELLISTALNAEGPARRILQKFALLLLSGWVFQKALKVDIHLHELKALLIRKAEAEIPALLRRDPMQSVIENLTAEIANNLEKFPHIASLSPRSKRYHYTAFWGCRELLDGKVCFNILSAKFKKLIEKNSSIGFRKTCEGLEKAGCLKRYYGDRYVTMVDFGLFKDYSYRFFLPGSKNAVELFSEIPSLSKNLKKLNELICDDSYGLDSESLQKFNDINEPLMKFAIVRLTAQTHRIIINKELAEKLKLKANEHLYLAPVPQEGIMMFSKEKMIHDAAHLTLNKSNDILWGEYKSINALLDMMKIKINIYARVTFFDITIIEDNMPIAIIKFDRITGYEISDMSKKDIFAFEEENIKSESHLSENRAYLLNDTE